MKRIVSDHQLLYHLFVLFRNTEHFKYLEALRGKIPLNARERADLSLIETIQKRIREDKK